MRAGRDGRSDGACSREALKGRVCLGSPYRLRERRREGEHRDQLPAGDDVRGKGLRRVVLVASGGRRGHVGLGRLEGVPARLLDADRPRPRLQWDGLHLLERDAQGAGACASAGARAPDKALRRQVQLGLRPALPRHDLGSVHLRLRPLTRRYLQVLHQPLDALGMPPCHRDDRRQLDRDRDAFAGAHWCIHLDQARRALRRCRLWRGRTVQPRLEPWCGRASAFPNRHHRLAKEVGDVPAAGQPREARQRDGLAQGQAH